MSAILALETGHVFHGSSIGVAGTRVGEVVFNTALTGYQETISDPSYSHQIITFTYPHIGNTGINLEDFQSANVHAAGIVVKSFSKFFSNWRACISLQDYLLQQQVVGISEVDTRGLTQLLRDRGSLRGCIMAGEIDEEYALTQAKNFRGLAAANLAKEASSNSPYTLNLDGHLHVVLLDFGVKANILNCLVQHGCKVTVLNADTKPKDILALKPDAILLSNGPGDPQACTEIISNIKELLSSELPILGICLGHQLLALALGAKTFKMDFGHHGSNHPVQDLFSKQVLITSQNHGFAVDESSLTAELIVTHRSLFDNTIQGLKHKHKPIFSFQGHPEAAPGPHDAIYLFDQFITAARAINAKKR